MKWSGYFPELINPGSNLGFCGSPYPMTGWICLLHRTERLGFKPGMVLFFLFCFIFWGAKGFLCNAALYSSTTSEVAVGNVGFLSVLDGQASTSDFPLPAGGSS